MFAAVIEFYLYVQSECINVDNTRPIRHRRCSILNNLKDTRDATTTRVVFAILNILLKNYVKIE